MLNEQNINNTQWLNSWLDEKYELSVNMIQEKEWHVVSVEDTLNPMEAEWLADSLNKRDIDGIIGVSFEFQGEPAIANVSTSRDSIMRFNWENSHKYILLTSSEEKFLYYKDQGNRFFLLCGDIDFIKEVYKCSFETKKLMYFNYWVDSDFNSSEEKTYLTNLWEKYSKFHI